MKKCNAFLPSRESLHRPVPAGANWPRWNEPDLHLEGEKPFINIRATTTKNHQQAMIALHPELVAELRTHVAKLPAGTSRIFAGVMPYEAIQGRLESIWH
jgi:hypothetical protein